MDNGQTNGCSDCLSVERLVHENVALRSTVTNLEAKYSLLERAALLAMGSDRISVIIILRKALDEIQELETKWKA